MSPETSLTKAAKNELHKVYHVYVDHEYIGKIEDQRILEEILDEKLESAKKQVKSPFIKEEITYIVERSFNPRYDNEKVKKRLENLLTVQTGAYGLKIGDELIGYFEQLQDVNEALEKYKQNYVQKRDLEQLKQEKDMFIFSEETLYLDNSYEQGQNQKELKVGETELTDVFLDHEIDIFQTEVKPNQLYTIEEALEQLNKEAVEEKYHSIQEGDVLKTIAKKYDLTVKELLKLNPKIKEDTLLQIGQKIKVTASVPTFDVISIEKSKEEKKIPYKTKIIESDDLYKGEEKVKQKGRKGKKEVLYKIEKKNGQEISREVITEQVTKKPQKKIIIKGTKVIPSRGSGNFIWPTNGGSITSYYGYRWGRMHRGIDIARTPDRTIKAADHGVVSFTGYKGGYGNKVVINHNNGTKTLYAHLSSIHVRPGQTIEKGTAIGVMGSTGHSTGTHLHFEIHQNGVPKNPMLFLR